MNCFCLNNKYIFNYFQNNYCLFNFNHLVVNGGTNCRMTSWDRYSVTSLRSFRNYFLMCDRFDIHNHNTRRNQCVSISLKLIDITEKFLNIQYIIMIGEIFSVTQLTSSKALEDFTFHKQILIIKYCTDVDFMYIYYYISMSFSSGVYNTTYITRLRLLFVN